MHSYIEYDIRVTIHGVVHDLADPIRLELINWIFPLISHPDEFIFRRIKYYDILFRRIPPRWQFTSFLFAYKTIPFGIGSDLAISVETASNIRRHLNTGRSCPSMLGLTDPQLAIMGHRIQEQSIFPYVCPPLMSHHFHNLRLLACS